MVSFGADLNAPTSDRWTAMMIASQNGHEPVVRLLVSSGADLNRAAIDGRTAVVIASDNGHRYIVRGGPSRGTAPRPERPRRWTCRLWPQSDRSAIEFCSACDAHAHVRRTQP